jgi:hypothetical protein
MLAHMPEAQPKHDTPYLYSGRAGPFGPLCLRAHSTRRALNSALTKKPLSILFSQEFLNQHNMMTIIFEYLIHDHNNT